LRPAAPHNLKTPRQKLTMFRLDPVVALWRTSRHAASGNNMTNTA
jgi:hypothetical protein